MLVNNISFVSILHSVLTLLLQKVLGLGNGYLFIVCPCPRLKGNGVWILDSTRCCVLVPTHKRYALARFASIYVTDPIVVGWEDDARLSKPEDLPLAMPLSLVALPQSIINLRDYGLASMFCGRLPDGCHSCDAFHRMLLLGGLWVLCLIIPHLSLGVLCPLLFLSKGYWLASNVSLLGRKVQSFLFVCHGWLCEHVRHFCLHNWLRLSLQTTDYKRRCVSFFT